MAKGDVVNGQFLAAGNFQPAAGVEVLICFLPETKAGDNYYLYNGTQACCILKESTNAPAHIRVPINNTNYLRYVFALSNGSYGGIQTK